MTITEAFKAGFNVINRRWQLVVVQLVLMVVNCLSMFVFVGLPLIIAILLFGLDVSMLAAPDSFMSMVHNPADLLTKYLGMVLIIITSILIYITVASALWLYVCGGTAGVIGRALIDPTSRFSLREFFTEARKMFFPLAWFSSYIALLLIAASVLFAVFGGGTIALVYAARAWGSTLTLFLGYFFSLVAILSMLAAILIFFAVINYGVAGLFFKGRGAIRTFNDTMRFLWNNQNAFWLYALCFFGYIAISFSFMLMVIPFKLIPVVGVVITLPVKILLSVVQSYLGLLVVSVIFAYYFDAEVKGTEPVTGIPAEPAGDGSTPVEDISPPAVPAQEEIPGEMDEKRES